MWDVKILTRLMIMIKDLQLQASKKVLFLPSSAAFGLFKAWGIGRWFLGLLGSFLGLQGIMYHDPYLGGKALVSLGVYPGRARRGDLRADSDATGDWLTFVKRPKADDTVVQNKYPELLSKGNRLDNKLFKDKIPYDVRDTPLNFMFTEYDVEMSFLPKEPLNNFSTGSPSSSINKENPVVNVEPLGSVNPDQLVENSTDSKGSPVREQAMVVASGSVAEKIKDQKCRIRGTTKAPIKCKLATSSPLPRVTRQKSSHDIASTTKAKVESSSYLTIFDDDAEGFPKAFELKTPLDYHLLISNITPLAWKCQLDNQSAEELLDLHDSCYARLVLFDNVVNRRSRKLLKVVDQVKGKYEIIKEREKDREEKCKELEAKCEVAMADFDKNPAVIVLCQKIRYRLAKIKKHQGNLDKMLLESQKWVGYKENLVTLELKVDSLEGEKARLEGVETQIRQEVDDVKRDSFDSNEDEVVPKVEDVSLVDGVFDGALGGDGDEDIVIGEGEEEEEKCDEDDKENDEGDHYLIKECWIVLEKYGYRK
ncbi:hypothetical protein Tco_0115181 [Tanacetum coccineum]